MNVSMKKDKFFHELRLWSLVLVVLILLCFIGVSYNKWLKESNTFHVRKIEISGNELLSEQEILQLGGLGLHESIWKLDLGKVTEGISTNPFIANVEVKRKLPDKLRIEVQEKQPVALLNFKGKFLCVDQEGLVLPSKPNKHYDLPVLSGNFDSRVEIGNRAEEKGVKQGLFFINQIREDRPGLYSQISELVVGKPMGLILYTKERGVPVWVGKEGYKRKIRYLEAILKRVKNEKILSQIKYIDLRFRGRIFVGMRA